MKFAKLKADIEHEIKAIGIYINMAIKLSNSGYPEMAKQFLARANDDVNHAYRLGIMLSNIAPNEVDTVDYTEIHSEYIKIKAGAVERIKGIMDEIKENDAWSIMQEALAHAKDHNEEHQNALTLEHVITRDCLKEDHKIARADKNISK